MKHVLLVAALAAVALAGCTSGDDGAISVVSKPADGKVDPLVLKANVAADEYSWSMGDGRAKLTGKEVSHVYGVTDGEFRVELTTVTAGESTKHPPMTITLGTGVNEAPTFTLELEWTWIQVGEEVTFAAVSNDAEGDPTLTQWFCQRQSDIALSGGGGHHGAGPGGVDFATGSANVIPTLVLNGSAPSVAASGSVGSDMCTDMQSSGYEDRAAVRGAFAQAGIYELTLLAKDPGHPGVPATTTVYVTDGPRVNGTHTESFGDEIQYGAPANADGPLAEAGMQDHIRMHEFEVQYPILSFKASISNDGGDGIPVEIQYQVFKGENGKGEPVSGDIDEGAGWIDPGSYSVVVWLRQGSNVGYTVDLEYEYQSDPTKLFEAPH